MSEELKLVTLNIEGSKHLETVTAFLKKEKPDVACLQEVFAKDIPTIESATGLRPNFVPLSRVGQENAYNIPPNGLWGLAFFTANKPDQLESFFYAGEANKIPTFTEPNSLNRALLVGTITKGKTTFTIGTTHFTWSPKGKATKEQQRDLKELQKILQQFDDMVLCGDFNAPRGRAIYSKLASMFTDHLPDDVVTTIDPDLHYAGSLELVVDTIFSTDEYVVDGVRVQSGISDHQAVIGQVQKVV